MRHNIGHPTMYVCVITALPFNESSSDLIVIVESSEIFCSSTWYSEQVIYNESGA